jgi:hypothetical protein
MLLSDVLGQGLILFHSSRAVQIGLNVSILEDWIDQMGIPPGVQSHLAPVHELLTWLQVRVFENSLGLSLIMAESLVH